MERFAYAWTIQMIMVCEKIIRENNLLIHEL